MASRPASCSRPFARSSTTACTVNDRRLRADQPVRRCGHHHAADAGLHRPRRRSRPPVSTRSSWPATASGEVAIAKSPWAKNPLGMAVGYEDRKVFGGNASDAVVQTQGELLGSGAPTPDRSGTLKFRELYSRNERCRWCRTSPSCTRLDASATAIASTEFDSIGGVMTYGSWKKGAGPTLRSRACALRGELPARNPCSERERAVRSGHDGPVDAVGRPLPGQQASLPADAGKAGSLTNLCQLTGVPTFRRSATCRCAFVQPDQQHRLAATPALGPEKADTTTLGLVYEPDYVDGLSITVDFWKIKINGAVSSPTASAQVINGCYRRYFRTRASGVQRLLPADPARQR